MAQLLDQENGLFFARQLEHIKARTYDVVYADLQYRMLFPVSMEAPAGATTITYQTYDHVGVAKIINNYAGDLPRSDVNGRETTIPVRTLAASFGYSVKEIKSARMVGNPLDQRRANSARRSIEELMNDIAYNGDSAHGLLGFVNHPNMPTSNAANGAQGSPLWVLKTPDEIIADITTAGGTVFETTFMKERINTILVPVAQWNYITSTRIPELNMTIHQYIMMNNPYLNNGQGMIIPVNELNGAGTGGTDIMIVYDRSPDKLQFEIPEDITFYNEQERNLEMVVPVSAECGGINYYYPLSALKVEGI